MFLKSNFFKKYNLFVLFIICLLGILLRVWGLSSKEFWYDEAYTGILVNLPPDQFFELIKFDVHPPIYINLLRGWVSLFGNSSLTIRLFSVLAGSLLIPTSYLLAGSLNIFKKHPFFKFAIPLIFAVNPFFVEYSKEARSYSLTALVFSTLFLSYYLASRYEKFNIRWLVTGAMMAVSFLTHYLTAVGITFLFIFDFIYTNFRKVSLKKYFLQKIKLYLSLGIVFLTLVVSFLPVLFIQYKNAPVLWWIPFSEPQRLATTLYIFLFGARVNSLGVPPALHFSFFPSPEVIGFIAFSFFIAGLFYLIGKLQSFDKKDFMLLPFVSIFPIIFILLLQIFNQRLYLERYLTPYAVFSVLLFFLLVFKLKKVFKYLTFTLYIIASLFLVININYQPQGFAKLAQELEKVKTKNTQVIFQDPISFTIAKYYLAKNPNLSVRIYNPKEKLDDWEIISRKEVLKDYTELKDKQRLFVFTTSKKPDIWFRQSVSIGTLYVYSTIPLFEKDLALSDL